MTTEIDIAKRGLAYLTAAIEKAVIDGQWLNARIEGEVGEKEVVLTGDSDGNEDCV